MAQGVAISDLNATLSTAWGSSYVNDFLHQGRVKKVYLQADAPFRMEPEDLGLCSSATIFPWRCRLDRMKKFLQDCRLVIMMEEIIYIQLHEITFIPAEREI